MNDLKIEKNSPNATAQSIICHDYDNFIAIEIYSICRIFFNYDKEKNLLEVE